MTNTKKRFILEQIKHRGFVEGQNLTEIAKSLNTYRTLLNQIVEMIEFFNMNYDLPESKNKLHEFYVHKIRKKGGNCSKVIICHKTSNKFKEIIGNK